MARLNDHPPAHVHVYKGDVRFEVDLANFEASEVHGKISGHELRQAEKLVRENAELLTKEWGKIHG